MVSLADIPGMRDTIKGNDVSVIEKLGIMRSILDIRMLEVGEDQEGKKFDTDYKRGFAAAGEAESVCTALVDNPSAGPEGPTSPRGEGVTTTVGGTAWARGWRFPARTFSKSTRRAPRGARSRPPWRSCAFWLSFSRTERSRE